MRPRRLVPQRGTYAGGRHDRVGTGRSDADQLHGGRPAEPRRARSYRLLGCKLTYHGELPPPGETLAVRDPHRRPRAPRRHPAVLLPLRLHRRRRAAAHGARWTGRVLLGAGARRRARVCCGRPEAGAPTCAPMRWVDPPVVECTSRRSPATRCGRSARGGRSSASAPASSGPRRTRAPDDPAGTAVHRRGDRRSTRRRTVGPRLHAVRDRDHRRRLVLRGALQERPVHAGQVHVRGAASRRCRSTSRRLGYTTRRDGWRFEPLPEQPFELKCRGQINPRPTRVVYEVFVEEVWAGPHPTLFARCRSASSTAKRVPRAARRPRARSRLAAHDDARAVEARRSNRSPRARPTRTGFAFDCESMLACAWGKPSDAFGSMYEAFDGTRRSPRLPGAPYHFISRVTLDRRRARTNAGRHDGSCAEYDIPGDAWYFDENGSETMPYAVLLEAALQPCGWLASYVGSAARPPTRTCCSATSTAPERSSRSSPAAGTLTHRVHARRGSRWPAASSSRTSTSSASRATGGLHGEDRVRLLPPRGLFENQVGLDDRRRAPALALRRLRRGGRPRATAGAVLRRRVPGSPTDAADARPGHASRRRRAAVGPRHLRAEKDVDPSEWFFKAHFFQDPVQPGSLGIEAMLQLLQFFMLDAGPGRRHRRSPVRADHARRSADLEVPRPGDPANERITSVMEITEIGTDDHGRWRSARVAVVRRAAHLRGGGPRHAHRVGTVRWARTDTDGAIPDAPGDAWLRYARSRCAR